MKTIRAIGGVYLIFLISLLIFAKDISGQQIDDAGFTPRIEKPTYPTGKGPLVLIDEGHNNFHTVNGRYKPFANLLRKDGYNVGPHKGLFSSQSLKAVDILVISNALHKCNVRSWRLPILQAFTKEEIIVVAKWVKDGGALLLIADHMPFPGAAKELASSFGFKFNNGFAFSPNNQSKIRFCRDDLMLQNHPISNGQNSKERINSFTTFAGQAFQIPQDAKPLLVFKKDYYSLMPQCAWEFKKDTPKISIEGWSQGAVKKYCKGKIAVFGEAASFTAQIIIGKKKKLVGVNSPDATDNAQFVLNVLHWLSGLI